MMTPSKKKLWKQPSPGYFQKGKYNYAPEVKQMRNYLDLLHLNHGNPNIEGIVTPGNAVGRYHDFHSVAE